MAKRSGVSIQTTNYKSFKGVDFTTDPALVDRQRSPLGTNMISDEGGNPEKRPGYKRIFSNLYGINGMYMFKCDHNDLLNISLTKNGVSVENPRITVSSRIYEKTGAYGATTVSIVPAVHAMQANYDVTVACGQYSHTETVDYDLSSVKHCLEQYGIDYNEELSDGTDVITFTTARHKLMDKHLLVHANELIFRVYEDGTNDTVFRYIGKKKSSAVFMNKKLFIFTGKSLLVYDGNDCVKAESVAYIPLTVIGKVPGSAPGGTMYESINYLTPYQKVSYKADGETAEYVLPYTDAGNITVWVDGTRKTLGTDYTYLSGTVTFTSGHIPAAPAAGAADNVIIQFSHEVSRYADRINKCTTAIAWGVNGASDRIVCTGDEAYPNRDYICGYLDGTYWPDTDYNIVGSDYTKIMGYRRMGDSLAIIKEDNGQDSSVFIRTSALDDDGNAMWFTKPCLSGVGGVSRFGFGNINDDQLVLTSNGVFAITTNTITSEKIAEVRSKYINAKLVKESMSDAVCCSFRNMFMIFFQNGHVYVLDGRQAKAYTARNETVFNYECYYWENCPATCVLVDEDNGTEKLYFGTADGKIYQFMFDETSMIKFSDGGYYSNGQWVSGTAIDAVWATKSDDDGDPMIYKTMLKKGNAVTLKPYSRSSAKVCIRTDKDTVDWQCNSGITDVFDWEYIDFSRFTFDSNESPREIPFNRKVKNYKRLQIIIRNNEINEGFGVYGIVKHYVTGNFAKK